MSARREKRCRMWGVLFADSWELALMPRWTRASAERNARVLTEARKIPTVVRAVTVLLPNRPKRRPRR